MIILESKILEIKAIKKKTTAKMFKDLKVGNRIKISVDIIKPEAVAKFIKVENITTKEINQVNSFRELPKILDCFEFFEEFQCLQCEGVYRLEELDMQDDKYYCPDCLFQICVAMCRKDISC